MPPSDPAHTSRPAAAQQNAAEATESTPERPPWFAAAGLLSIAFFVMMSYGVARPAVESLFLKAYGADSLPLAWVVVALVALCVVMLYGRVVTRFALHHLYAAVCGITAAGFLATLLAHKAGVPGATFLMYVVKDVYIVVLVEIFWSMASSLFTFRTARWLYGFFGVLGSFGGMVANLGMGKLAKLWGTANTLWLMLPLFGVLALIALAMGRVLPKHPVQKDRPRFSDGFLVVKKSRYLGYVLALIALVQVVITLIDYQTNQLIQQTYPTTDGRTAVIGQIYAAIDGAAVVLQAATGVFIRVLGVPTTLFGTPGLLFLAVLSFVISPQFFSMAVAKVASKALDYSLFRGAKELLYLPLSHREKTQGKAVVDMLTYRVAKGAASALLLGLLAIEASTRMVSVVCLGLIGVWVFVTAIIVPRYKAAVADSNVHHDDATTDDRA